MVMTKYATFSLDRHKLKRSELDIDESEIDDIETFAKVVCFDEEMYECHKNDDEIWISEEGDELVIDGDEVGYFIKKIK
jgi:hypothetical protein